MVTGDYHQTAIAVAKDVGMLKADVQTIIVGATQSTTPAHGSMLQLPTGACTPALPLDPALPLTTVSESSPFTIPLQPHPLVVPRADEAWTSISASSDKAIQRAAHSPNSSSHMPQAQIRFSTATGGKQLGRIEPAIAAIAAGKAQCVVTGDALEQLLQSTDMLPLETVMRHVVIFARMKPAQKGQVVDLLNIRGLHQMHHGQPHHIQVNAQAHLSRMLRLSLGAPDRYWAMGHSKARASNDTHLMVHVRLPARIHRIVMVPAYVCLTLFHMFVLF